MTIIGQVLYWALQLFFYAMLARFISDLVMSFSQSWKPKGLLLPILDFAYTLTDPPIKFVRRFVPPLRLGSISLDLAWTVVVFAVIILQGFARSL
jgi:YggT family protein